MWTRIVFSTVFFAIASLAADPAEVTRTVVSMAPVLRESRNGDSGVVLLPGPPVPPIPVKPPRELRDFTLPPPPPLPETALPGPAPIALTRAPIAPKLPTSVVEEPRSIARRAPKPVFPPDFDRDSAIYCQKRIGEWSEPDVYNLFGRALRHRPSGGEDQESGLIYAFSDPTGRYREIELDFAASTGLLRSVFVYPWKMTWQECRRLWGTNVTSTPANKGRTFYSFVNMNLDVLVGPDGKVVSLGLY